MQKVHFIGIGGIGMSSLAQYYLAKGWRVSGSDLSDSEILEKLKKAGMEIFIGHKTIHLLEKVDRVIFSAAVRDDNPEMEQAKILGCDIIGYAQALGELTRQYITIAVSGAHGKSTTTALLSLMLIEAGLDPTVIIGTKVKEFDIRGGGNNFRFGKSRYLVIEADEYNKSFLNYYPTIAVITNIDKEHLDTYGSLENIINSFAKYFNNINGFGALITSVKDKNTSQALKIWKFNKPKNIACKMINFKMPKERWSLKIFGDFNQLNCEAAWQAARFLGVNRVAAEKAVGKYGGSWRRMEELVWKRPAFANPPSHKASDGQRASAVGQKLFSDYAHHPTEIKATIKAFKDSFPRKKLAVVFQPHQMERLNFLFDDFVGAFNYCDRLIILPTYEVAGRETLKQKTAKDLYLAIKTLRQAQDEKSNIFHLRNLAGAIKMVKEFPNSVVVFMGAGSIDQEARRYFKSKLF